MNEEENNMYQDPSNWKLGFIYFNPKDKRVWVLKRLPGMGLTINFGNPFSVIVVLLLIAMAIFFSKLQN